jgi:hypothetical protein
VSWDPSLPPPMAKHCPVHERPWKECGCSAALVIGGRWVSVTMTITTPADFQRKARRWLQRARP